MGVEIEDCMRNFFSFDESILKILSFQFEEI